MSTSNAASSVLPVAPAAPKPCVSEKSALVSMHVGLPKKKSHSGFSFQSLV